MIDGHVHLWSDDTARYPWQPAYGAPPPSVPGSVEFVLGILDRHGVERAVAVQPRAYGTDHRYLLDAAARFPDRIISVAAIDPSAPAATSLLADLARMGVKGLRLDPMGWSGPWLSDGTVLPLWDEAARLNFPIELLIRPDQLPDLVPLADRIPTLPIVVEHLGRYGADPGQPIGPLVELARFPNISLKLSALDSISSEPPPYRDLWPTIEAVVETFGPERIMWGSDLPWIGAAGYGPALGAIATLPFLAPADVVWLLGGTARRIFSA